MNKEDRSKNGKDMIKGTKEKDERRRRSEKVMDRVVSCHEFKCIQDDK